MTYNDYDEEEGFDLLPEEIEELEPREIKITFVDTDGVEKDKIY